MPVKPTLALCLLVGACITETTHPTTTVTARWTVQDLVTGLVVGCPAGFDVAELVATPVDGGAAITTDFPCADGTGVSTVAATLYTFTIAIRADDGTLFAQSLPQSLDLTDGDSQWLDATILDDGGYAHVTWTLVGATSGTTLSCADALVDAIVITATTGFGTYIDQLPCEDEVGQTRALPIGTYNFTIAASRQGQAIGTTALADQIIDNRNGVTELGSVHIALVGL